MRPEYLLALTKEGTARAVKNSCRPEIIGKNISFKLVDLFSGCGGLSQGFFSACAEEGARLKVELAIDSNKEALEVYRNNLPIDNDDALAIDILNLFSIEDIGSPLTLRETELKEKIGELDFLVAGPPCQGHSDLNNSTRRNDPRNKLYLACIRAVTVLRPKNLIIENVPAVVHSKEGVVSETYNFLKEIGYSVRELSINFLDLGLPQTRNRHVLLASIDEEFLDLIRLPSNREDTASLRDFIFDIQDVELDENIMSRAGRLSDENLIRVDYLFDNDLYDLPDSQRPSCHKDKEHSYKSVYGRLRWDRPAQTLTSGYGSMGQGRYIHPSKRRTINSLEAARIQGFPDYYDFSSVGKVTDLRKMIANAVPPQLTYIIAKHYVRRVLNGEKYIVGVA